MFQDNSTQEAIDKAPGRKGTWKWFLIGLAVIILAVATKRVITINSY